jgi:glycosyltransferase involved in cell wall biosynthesis
MIAHDFPRCKLVLVGSPLFDSDAYERELRDAVEALGLHERVIFAGYRRDLPQVLAALDIYVHSSVEKDTSPLAVVSAMSAGKPIVSTNVAGVAELFSDGEAVLVPPADPPAMAAALRTLIANPDMRLSLSKAARHKAETALSLPQFARRCEAIFSEVLSSKF